MVKPSKVQVPICPDCGKPVFTKISERGFHCKKHGKVKERWVKLASV